MFVALARAVLRHRGAVWVGTVLVLALAVASAIRGGSLTTGTIEGTESTRAAELARGALGAQTDGTVAAVFRHAPMKATDPVFAAALQRVLEPVAALPTVEGVVSALNAPEQARARFVSSDGNEMLVLVRLRGGEKDAVRAFPQVRQLLRSGPFDVALTGKPAFLGNLNRQLEDDLLRAELISFPLALLVLLWVFRTVVAALAPGRGGRARGARRGRAWCSRSLTSWTWPQYTLNVCSLIGLGVAIDYSLFMVSRYREELHAGRAVERAVEIAVDTAGRVVAFSGLAVAAGLSGPALLPGLVPGDDGAGGRSGGRLRGALRPHHPAGAARRARPADRLRAGCRCPTSSARAVDGTGWRPG